MSSKNENAQRVDKNYFFKTESDYLSISETAAYLGISESGVKQKIRQGAFRSYKPSSKLLYVKLGDLKRWIESCCSESAEKLSREADIYLMKAKFNSMKNAA
jgi:excisionase family DNA binding protein